MAIYLRGTCSGCGNRFFTRRTTCKRCGAPLAGIYWYKFAFKGQRIEESTGLTADLEAARALEVSRRDEICLRIWTDEARKTRAKILAEPMPDGSPAGPLFETYAENFLAWSKVVHRPNTYNVHEDNINTLKRYFSGRRLDEIRLRDVENFKVRRILEPSENCVKGTPPHAVSGVTVNRALATLHLLYERATKDEVYSGRNPVHGIDYFPEGPRQRILSFEEQERYLQHAGELLRDFMVLMTEMGFRPQDLMCLEEANVDLGARLLRLWPLPAAGELAKDGKTPAARRSIPITDDMLPIIERRLEQARQLKTRWLFPSPKNAQKHIAGYRKGHKEALAKAGITDRVRIYDLRHTGLTRLHESGLQDLTLMRIAGHTKLQMTSRYIRISEEAKQEAVEKLEEYKKRRKAG